MQGSKYDKKLIGPLLDRASLQREGATGHLPGNQKRNR